MKQGSSFAKKQGTMIALACAAAFAAPQAMAQVGGPDFGSGKGLTLSVDFLTGIASKSSSGATNGAQSDTVRRTEVFSSSSSVYFKGSEKLGGSFLQGWGFVITWDYDPDEYNRRGANEVATTVIGTQTSVGDFFLGVMDSPFKQLGSSNVATGSSFGNGLSQSGTLGTPGFRTGTAKGGRTGDAESGAPGTTTSTMSFYRLNANSINYYSPVMNGFKFYAQWVPGDSDIPTGGGIDRDTNAWSVGLTYNNGPFNIGYVYEKRKDYLWGAVLTGNNFGAGSAAAGAGTHSSDNGQMLTAAYTFGNVKVGAYYTRLDYSQSSPAALNLTDMDADQWYIGTRIKVASGDIGLFYASAGSLDCSGNNAVLVATCNTDTGMKSYGIGYRHNVSKQLRMFVSASRMDNDRNAQYSGHSTVGVGLGNPTNAAGLTRTNFSVGMAGSF